MKASIPAGTRDFGPDVMIRRNYLLGVIRSNFERFGFLPVETPAIENIETLTGKYGEEGDQLLFRLLNNGDFLSKLKGDLPKSSKDLLPHISERALRYDLTVPFARFVVMNRNDITLPFRRYQMQPVWRADRPQRGRYREFIQCDADIIGSDSLLNEADLVRLLCSVFSDLKLPVTIKLNNRKILNGIAASCGLSDLSKFAIVLDKLDKIGAEGIVAEANRAGLGDPATACLKSLAKNALWSSSSNEFVDYLKQLCGDLTPVRDGLNELSTLFSWLPKQHHGINLEIDLSLARGLTYYTGTIVEVKLNHPGYAVSISGGGRYDDLTGIFGWMGISGVGISFGADRIYDCMELLQLFPNNLNNNLDVMLVNFGNECLDQSIECLHQLRTSGFRAMLYPDHKKISKQFEYANALQAAFVVITGPEEIKEEMALVKNMRSGQQEKIAIASLLNYLKHQLHNHDH